MSLKEKFVNAGDFTLYYGTGRQLELGEFDIAIVEPSGQTRDSISWLKQKNTLIFAYISIIEVIPGTQEFIILKEEDFLNVSGICLTNQEFGTYLADLRSKRWTRFLFHKIGKLFIDFGYDGIFIDTIGDIERVDIPRNLQIQLAASAENFLIELKASFPNNLIIQNNGFELACAKTYRYIDGICWENPLFDEPQFKPWHDRIVCKLEELNKKMGIKILLLLEETESGSSNSISDLQKTRYQSALKVSKENDFLIYLAPQGYTKGINNQKGF